MNLVTLNTWGGRVGSPLKEFLQKYSEEVDIFCLQEIFNRASDQDKLDIVEVLSPNSNLFDEISLVLKSHKGFFCQVYKNVYGIAMFLKNNIKVLDSGEILLCENKNYPNDTSPDADHTRKMQWLKIQKKDMQYLVVNVHGHWIPGEKIDSENSINQSKTILDFVDKVDLPTVICGDFNLRPDTTSIKIVEEKFENLITKNKVKTTRSSLYTGTERFADYIFVSQEIKVKDFKVLATDGVYIGGDLLNADIMQAKLWNYFGASDSWGDQGLPVPLHIYQALNSWHSITSLNNLDNMELLKNIAYKHSDPQALERLLYLIKTNVGFEIYESIEKAKKQLSEDLEAKIIYQDGPINLDLKITRDEFEIIINSRVEAVKGIILKTLEKAGVKPDEVDKVVRTGGSSLIPVFADMLEEIFGREKITLFETFTSIASGLALD